jgi:hypoxanthine phosphoribosyltransferase
MKPISLSFFEVVDSIPFEAMRSFSPDIVIAIERGGLVFASVIAYRLGVELRSVKASLYDDSKPARKRFDKPRIDMHAISRIDHKRVLIVDDVSNSGATMAAVKQAILSAGANEAKTFVYAGKADYSCRSFEKCLKFPWEEQNDIKD